MLRRRGCRVAVIAALLAAAGSNVAAVQPVTEKAPQQGTPPAPLFRVILNDGTALVSFGEFTRVGGRVVFSMPIDSSRSDRLQLVNLPESAVNWESTEQYSAAARYAQYVATRGEADFAVLTGQVASALSEIALAKDPARRVQLAERVRQTLIAWPLEHYGYRSADINDMLSLLAGTLSELRDDAGVRRFDLSLVATIAPPTMPLLPDPTPTQAIDQVLIAARLSDVPAERITLLRSAISLIDQTGSRLPRTWARQTRAMAESILEAEVDVERRYAVLSRAAVAKTTAAAARADVRAVERAVAEFQANDRALGQRRKEQVSALLALLQEQLDSARRLRLLRDQWARKVAGLRAYQDAVSGPMDRLAKLGPKLKDVRTLAGPDVWSLPGLIQSFERVSRQLALVKPPLDAASAHATLQSAAELGQQAMRTREAAAAQGDLATAWNASSAAAGSIMMLAEARRQIEALMRQPELR
jgi:hypothetical protein